MKNIYKEGEAKVSQGHVGYWEANLSGGIYTQR